MPGCFKRLKSKNKSKVFKRVMRPVINTGSIVSPLESRGNRKLQMTFEDLLNALVLYHLEEFDSGRHLLQALKEDEFAKSIIATQSGIKKSTFFDTVNSQGLEQLIETFKFLYKEAATKLPNKFAELGDLVAIDGSLIDATLSMHWADYRKNSKKAKTHMGFDVNRGIPKEIYISDGKTDERPYVGKILEPGQTGIMDRYYQYHKNFDLWQSEGKHFVCRIRANTTKTLLKNNEIKHSIVFYDAVVQLGTTGVNQTGKPVRVVGYKVTGTEYWIATDRFDLTAEDIANIYKLRWDIEVFFGWWKRHLKVYHIIARSQYGLMVQIFAGLITYLLLAIYCREEYNEEVSIKRVRELRFQIRNEAASIDEDDSLNQKPDS